MLYKDTRITAVFFALTAAVCYAASTPFSKLLMDHMAPTFVASFLYLGAGIGIGILYRFQIKREDPSDRLTGEDLPYTIGMIVLDIAAPIFLMIGISIGSAANASLLGNFEIVSTTLIALLLFREKVTARLWTAIFFITAASIILSFEGAGSFQFSVGSLLVLLATCCWGLENNCTRKISDKSTYEIVTLKGLCSGCGSFLVALLIREPLPPIRYIVATMILGFFAYGLSIFLYIRAQRDLGAARTSAYYAVAPFVGAFFSFVINREHLTAVYLAALLFMTAGSVFVVCDTLARSHIHGHMHTIVHTHDHSTHTHVITHEHAHDHFTPAGMHIHRHSDFLNSREHRSAHAANNSQV